MTQTFKAGEIVDQGDGKPYIITGYNKETDEYELEPYTTPTPPKEKPDSYLEARATQAKEAVVEAIPTREEIPGMAENLYEKGVETVKGLGEEKIKRRDEYLDSLESLSEKGIVPSYGKRIVADVAATTTVAKDFALSVGTGIAASIASIADDSSVIADTTARDVLVPLLASVSEEGTMWNTPTGIRHKVMSLEEQGVSVTPEMKLNFVEAVNARDASKLDKAMPQELQSFAKDVIVTKKAQDKLTKSIEESQKASSTITDEVFEFTGAETEGPIADIAELSSAIIPAAGAVKVLKVAQNKSVDKRRKAEGKLVDTMNALDEAKEAAEERIVVAPSASTIIKDGGVPRSAIDTVDVDSNIPDDAFSTVIISEVKGATSIHVAKGQSNLAEVARDIPLKGVKEIKYLTNKEIDDTLQSYPANTQVFDYRTLSGDTHNAVIETISEDGKPTLRISKGITNLGTIAKDMPMLDVSKVQYLTNEELAIKLSRYPEDVEILEYDVDSSKFRKSLVGADTPPTPDTPPPFRTDARAQEKEADRKAVAELEDAMVAASDLPEIYQATFRDYAIAGGVSEAVFAGGQAPGSEEYNAVTNRVLLPLSAVAGAYAVKGTKEGLEALYDAAFKKSGDEMIPANKAYDVASIQSSKTLDKYFSKIFKIDEDTGLYDFRKAPKGTWAKYRTNELEMHNIIEQLVRHKATELGINVGSKDVMELSPHWTAKWMRENHKSLAHGWLYGDEKGNGGFYLNKSTGMTEVREGIKSYTQIYKDAEKYGGKPDDVKAFQVAQDAMDNYTNLHNEIGESIANATKLAGTSVNGKKWNSFIRDLFAGDNALTYIPFKNTAAMNKAKDKVVAQAESILGDIKDIGVRGQIEEHLYNAIDSATRRSSIEYLDAKRQVDMYTKSTPWANKAKEDLTKLHTHILDEYVNSGLVRKEQAAVWKQRHPNYLPNYKVIQVLGAGGEYTGVSNTPRKLKALSARTISPKDNIDPIAAEYMYITDAGYRIAEANVRKSMLDTVLGFTTREEFNKWFSYADKDKLVQVLDDIQQGKGKDKYTAEEILQDDVVNPNQVTRMPRSIIHVEGSTIEVPFKHNWMFDLFRDSRTTDLKSDNWRYNHRGALALHTVRNWSRNVITKNPAFALSTMTKELMDSPLFSELPTAQRLKMFNALHDVLTIKKLDPETYRLFNSTNAGLYHGNLYGIGGPDAKKHKELTQTFVADILQDKSLTTKLYDKVNDALDEVLRASDNAPRMRYYKTLVANGYSKEAALRLAKSQGVNFTQRGLNPTGMIDTLDYFIPFTRVGANSIDRATRRMYYENKKFRNAYLQMGLLYFTAETLGLVPDAEQLGLTDWQKDRGIPLGTEIVDGFSAVIPSGFLMDLDLAKNMVSGLYDATNTVTNNLLANQFREVVGDEAMTRIENNPDSMRILTGSMIQYMWDKATPSAAITTARSGLGLTNVAKTFATNTDNYGNVFVDRENMMAESVVTDKSHMGVALAAKEFAKYGVHVSEKEISLGLDAVFPTVYNALMWGVDTQLANMGIVPERPEIAPAANVIGRYFGVATDNKGATEQFYKVYQGIRDITEVTDKYKNEIEKDLAKGLTPNAQTVELYQAQMQENQPFYESIAILEGYQEQMKELREKATNLIWDKDPSLLIAKGEGRELKRKMIKDIKEEQGQLAKEAMTALQSLPYGSEHIEMFSVPFSDIIRTVVDLKLPKRKEGATYDKSIDHYRTDDIVYEDEVSYEPMSNLENWGQPSEVIETVIQTAEENGLNPNTAVLIAAMESDLKPNAKSPTSSATGIFQITQSTWKNLLDRRIGKEYDITSTSDRQDPLANIRMGVLLMKDDNDRAVVELGRDIDFIDQYALHHFGYDKGIEFIRTYESAPWTPINKVLDNNQYYANPYLKHGRGQARTVGQVVSLWTQKANDKYKQLTSAMEIDNVQNTDGISSNTNE